MVVCWAGRHLVQRVAAAASGASSGVLAAKAHQMRHITGTTAPKLADAFGTGGLDILSGVSPVSQNKVPGTQTVSNTNVVIIGSGPAGHTAAIYAGRAQLAPILFEGNLANGVAAGGQLTTTTDVENFPGFPNGILGSEICDRLRQQSINSGATVHTETVTRLELNERPFKIHTQTRLVNAETVIIATGAVARRLDHPGATEFWQRGISACAVCDGAAPIFRGVPLAVIGGGDTAMEEALFLTRYGSKVYVLHRRDELRASKVMRERALRHPKIDFLFNTEVVSAHGSKTLESLTIRNNKTDDVTELAVGGLFYAIGHDPATAFLEGQLDLTNDGYIVTTPGRTSTSVRGVFAAGDVQDHEWRQAVTAAGSGCMAALEAERFLASKL
eukprot:m.458010 g.458010  ORF g.458010 m.458010 type:complete len:387 (-) comp21399_c0_seq1:202-1362(-)